MASETWGDMVRRVAAEYDLPEPGEGEIHFILWEWTAFPFAEPDHVEEQVREYMEPAAASQEPS